MRESGGGINKFSVNIRKRITKTMLGVAWSEAVKGGYRRVLHSGIKNGSWIKGTM